ncbi:hypothetical protein [Streptomyces lavendulae]|uniref:hypothetical protein n=1 Tax=Streptomyces lavendulae TaxID=1914 RepID=UPI0024A4A86D|nr:hypothetical protein [Streptomyces lavendulae]GLX20198.1 hypothetical protein Slala01_38420 [Streptomyces lavendulae subsp. lavendulae]GLX27367.1 hypothetical protein Slala02_31870 [Streptomyces lavendulae subsp. lavendulae]
MAEHEESSGGVPPLDEEAAWAAIVAGYGQEPPDPPGARPFRPIENLMLPEEDVKPEPAPEPKPGPEPKPAPKPELGSSITFAPGVGAPAPTPGPGPGPGPRDHTPAEPADEGHFVPPEPELPEADTTAKFAWLAVVGGPVLLLLAVLLQWDMTWWLTTLGIGGFLGGFATLIARMSGGEDDDDDDPGRGAVV